MTVSTPSLFDKIHTAMKHNPHVAVRNMQFQADHGQVVLEGKVSSFFQKQMAQETLLRIDGVQRIENRLVVDR